jgi:DNA-directed RNA polymerase sigma subunit (sigma70/sigma32)
MLSEHSLQRRLLDPERAVLFAEVWTVAQTCLHFRDLDVLRRRFLDGQTYREIGKVWDVTKQRAQWLVRDALYRLQVMVRFGSVWKYGATYDRRKTTRVVKHRLASARYYAKRKK